MELCVYIGLNAYTHTHTPEHARLTIWEIETSGRSKEHRIVGSEQEQPLCFVG